MNTSKWLRSRRGSSDVKWNKNVKIWSRCFWEDELIRFSTHTKKKNKSLTLQILLCRLRIRKFSNRKKGSKQHKFSDTKHQSENTLESPMALVCLIQTSLGSRPSSRAYLENLRVGNKDQDWRSRMWTCGRSQRHSTTLAHSRSNIKIRRRVCCPPQRRTLDSAMLAEEPYVVTCREVAKTSWTAWRTLLPSIISRTTFRVKSRSVAGSSVKCLTTSYHMSRLFPWAPHRVAPVSSDRLISSVMQRSMNILRLPKSTNLTSN